MKDFQFPPATLSDALMLINADNLRPMLALTGVPKPLPTRKHGRPGFPEPLRRHAVLPTQSARRLVLGIADEYVPAAPPSTASVTVYPNLRLQWEGPISPDERLLIEMWATAESDGAWRLDSEKAFSAIESGHDVDALRQFLAARDDQPLPEMVEGFLRRTERDARALSQVGPALLVECASAEIADRIAADKRAARLCLRAGERHLAVYAAKAKAFRRAIHALGYGMPHG